MNTKQDKVDIKSKPIEQQGTSTCQILRSILSVSGKDDIYPDYAFERLKAACDLNLVVHPSDESSSLSLQPISLKTRYVPSETYLLMTQSYLNCLNKKTARECTEEQDRMYLPAKGR